MKKLSVFLIFIIVLLSSGCTEPVRPVVVTHEIAESDVTVSTAVIKGEITDNGTSSPTECGFYWGLDPGEMEKVKQADNAEAFSQTLTGLVEHTTYYFQAYAVSNDGVGAGEIREFIADNYPLAGELLKNCDLEEPDLFPWWQQMKFYQAKDFVLEKTTEQSFSPSNSLKIFKPTLDADSGSFWFQEIYNDIPLNKKLTLSAKIKGINLTGNGAGIGIQCVAGTTSNQFVTTEGSVSIKGTFDWTEYTVILIGVAPETTCIKVFLMFFPGTTGTLYFDDIHLIAV